MASATSPQFLALPLDSTLVICLSFVLSLAVGILSIVSGDKPVIAMGAVMAGLTLIHHVAIFVASFLRKPSEFEEESTMTPHTSSLNIWALSFFNVTWGLAAVVIVALSSIRQTPLVIADGAVITVQALVIIVCLAVAVRDRKRIIVIKQNAQSDVDSLPKPVKSPRTEAQLQIQQIISGIYMQESHFEKNEKYYTYRATA